MDTHYKSKKVELTNGVTYAITITLNRDNQYNNVRHEFNMSLEKISHHYRNIGEFKLYPELTQAGTIHYHGLLLLKDRIKYGMMYKRHIRNIGFICLRNVTDIEGWKAYSTETLGYMKQLLNLTDSQLPLTREVIDEHVYNIKQTKKANLKRQEVGPVLYDINPPLAKGGRKLELSPLGDGEKQGCMRNHKQSEMIPKVSEAPDEWSKLEATILSEFPEIIKTEEGYRFIRYLNKYSQI